LRGTDSLIGRPLPRTMAFDFDGTNGADADPNNGRIRPSWRVLVFLRTHPNRVTEFPPTRLRLDDHCNRTAAVATYRPILELDQHNKREKQTQPDQLSGMVMAAVLRPISANVSILGARAGAGAKRRFRPGPERAPPRCGASKSQATAAALSCRR